MSLNALGPSASLLMLTAVLCALFAPKRRRDRLEIIAFEPDRLTSVDGTIRTSVVIHNPVARDNKITALRLAIRDSSRQYTLEAALISNEVPSHSTARVAIAASGFEANTVARECIFLAEMTDAFGRIYKFEQPFINMRTDAKAFTVQATAGRAAGLPVLRPIAVAR